MDIFRGIELKEQEIPVWLEYNDCFLMGPSCTRRAFASPLQFPSDQLQQQQQQHNTIQQRY